MNFGNILGGIERQLNPFDHGATYNNPQPQQQRPAPARTPAPVQNRPGSLQVSRTPAPQTLAQPVQRAQPLQVRPAAVPLFQQPHIAPPVQPLNVHVAPQQPLHVGNQQVIASPNAHTGVADNANQIQQMLHPNLVSQVQHNLGQKLAPARAAISQAQEVGQQFVTRPVAELNASRTGQTLHPSGFLGRNLIGATQVQPIQTAAMGVQDTLAHNKNPIIRALATPAAIADVGLHVAQDAPIIGGAVKGGAKLTELAGKELAPALKGAAAALPHTPLNETGAIKLPNINFGNKAQAVKNSLSLTPRITVPEQNALRDYSDHLIGLHNADAQTIQLARNAAAKHGIDITSGPVATRLDNTASVLDRIGKPNEGGFVRLPGQKTELMATHNLSEDNLAHADQLGGIPQASVGIVDPKRSAIDGFGDVTLVGNEKLVDPKIPGTRTYASDVYSVRQPKGEIQAGQGTISNLRQQFKAANDKYGKSNYIGFDSADNLLEGMANEPSVMAQFLENKGIKPDVSVDQASNPRYAFSRQIRDANLQDNFQQYLEKTAKDAGAESKIFAGWTNSGQKRLLPENMDNILSTMRKERLKAGESFFGSSIGGIRGAITPKFKSLEDIYNAKDRLTTNEKMEATKELLDNKLNEFQGMLEKHVDPKTVDGNRYTEYDRQLSSIGDYLRGGSDKKWFHQKFPTATPEILKKLDDFKKEIQTAPTEYFESVSDRAVKLNEFEKALVPENASPETIARLKAHGVEPVTYKPGERQKMLQKLMAEDNKARGFGRQSVPGSHAPTIISKGADAAKRSLFKPMNEHGAVPINPAKGDARAIPTTETKTATQPTATLPHEAAPATAPVAKVSGGSLPKNTTKVAGLTKGIQGSAEFSPTLQKSVVSSYDPFTNKAATANTAEFMKQPHDTAFKQVMQTLTSDGQGRHIPGASGNVGVKFGKQEVSNAGALMKALDQKGDHAGAQAIHDALRTKLTNAGQTAQATSLIYNRTPEGLANMARKSLTDAGVKTTPELQAKLDAGLQAIKSTKDGTRANDLARKQYDRLVGTHLPTSNGTKLLSLYKTGILSSPKTAVKVLGAGLPNMVLENSADLAAAPVDKLVSLFTGKRSMTAPSVGSMTVGAKQLPTALKDAGIRFKDDIAMPGSTGLAQSELSGTNARPHGANFGIAKDGGRTKLDKATGGVSSKLLNGYTSSIGRVHGAFQTLPYEVRGAQSLYQTAKAEAINKGLKGQAMVDYIHTHLATPTTNAKNIAEESSQYATSQQHTALGDAASSIQHTMPGGQIIAPITRIPGAVATQVVNYSPAGFVKTAGSALLDKKAGNPFNQQAFSRGIGRAIVGSGLMAGGAALATQGRVSGAYPKDKATQQLWVSANIPANSVYVGGKAYPNEPWKNTGGTWQQISSPGGAGAQAALTGGAAIDGYKKGGVQGAALGGLQGGASIVTNQPYLTGVSGAMGAINTPTQAKSFFDQTAGSVVPNFLRDVAGSTDPLQRQTSVQSPITSMKNSITNGIPGLREKNQPQVDVFGNTLKRNNGVLNSALNPLNPQSSTPSDLTSAMGAVHNNQDVNGKALPIPTQIAKKYTIKDSTGKTIPLTDAQRTAFIQQSGQGAQGQLNTLINGDTFKNATPEQQSKMIDSIVSGARDATKQSFGNSGKLTGAAKAYNSGTLPSISTAGKVTDNAASNLNPQLAKDQAKILNSYANMSAQDRTKAANTNPAFDYQYAAAKYANDKLNGSLSVVQDIKAQAALAKEQVGSNFDKATRDLYSGLTAAQLYDYASTNPDGNAIVDKVLAYGDALKAAGVESKNKFRTSKGYVNIHSKSQTASTKAAKSAAKSASTAMHKQLAISRQAKNYYSAGSKKSRNPSFKLPSLKAPKVASTKGSLKLASYKVPKAQTIKKPKGVLA